MSNLISNLRRRLQFGAPVIVVTGLPRSGTSMVMRMLQAGGVAVTTDGERQADEDNPLGYFEVERVKRLAQEADKSWLSQSRGKAIKVISHLLQSLPHDNYYRVILCERDLGEVLKSQNVMLQRREQPNPIEDAQAREHYERHLAHIRIFMKIKRNMEFLPVRYDEAIGSPRAFAERLNAFLGGRLNVDRMVEVVDSKLYRNRKERVPVARASLSLIMAAAALGAALVAPDTAHAYVGPGAGFALVGSFLALLAAVASSILSLVLWPIRFVLRWRRRRKAMSRASARRVVVLGLDGLDPTLAEQWMAEGQLPNLSALAKSGSFTRLGTTYPAISPVAWSSFMTGVDPARHNIFDFLDRDVRTYKPRLSSSDIRPASRTIRVGEWLIPVGRPIDQQHAQEQGVLAHPRRARHPVERAARPADFPAREVRRRAAERDVRALICAARKARSLTTRRASRRRAQRIAAPEQTGGERRPIKIEDGVIRTSLAGPDSPLRAEAKPLEIPFEISAIDPAKKTCLLTIGRKKYVLREREYSPWIKLDFKAGFGVAVRGIARFYVTSMAARLQALRHADQHRSGQAGAADLLAAHLLDLPVEAAGRVRDARPRRRHLGAERGRDRRAGVPAAGARSSRGARAQFFNALEKSRDGAVVCVFDGTDRLQHMFFRYLDSKHPANRGRDTVQYRDTILQMYQRCRRNGRARAAPARAARSVHGDLGSRLPELPARHQPERMAAPEWLAGPRSGEARWRRLVRERRLGPHQSVCARPERTVHQSARPRSARHRRAGRGD